MDELIYQGLTVMLKLLSKISGLVLMPRQNCKFWGWGKDMVEKLVMNTVFKS